MRFFHALIQAAVAPATRSRMIRVMASSLLLGSQRVLPGRAMACGFSFRYPTLASALAAL